MTTPSEKDTIVRFGISYISRENVRAGFPLRRLWSARLMRDTREEAQELLNTFLAAGDLGKVHDEVEIASMRVDAFSCWHHGDPKGVYVREETPEELERWIEAAAEKQQQTEDGD